MQKFDPSRFKGAVFTWEKFNKLYPSAGIGVRNKCKDGRSHAYIIDTENMKTIGYVSTNIKDLHDKTNVIREFLDDDGSVQYMLTLPGIGYDDIITFVE